MAKLNNTGKIVIGGAALVGAGLLLKKLFFDKKAEPIEEIEGEEVEEATDETYSEEE